MKKIKRELLIFLNHLKQNCQLVGGLHPSALPLQFGIITALGSSKKEGAQVIIKNFNLSFDEVLGIGDTISDWDFIQLCGYAATVNNGNEKLKELIKIKGEGKYYIGKSVDENGILDVLEYFSL